MEFRETGNRKYLELWSLEIEKMLENTVFEVCKIIKTGILI